MACRCVALKFCDAVARVGSESAGLLHPVEGAALCPWCVCKLTLSAIRLEWNVVEVAAPRLSKAWLLKKSVGVHK